MSVHIYQTIYDDLLDQIKTGALSPGDQLTSEADLAASYGVSRMTVRQALTLLEGDGLVVKRRGSGTYIAHQDRTFRHLNRLASFREEIRRPDANVSTAVLKQTVDRPPAEVVSRLELRKGQDAINLVRLRVLNGEPAAVQSSWLPYRVVPALARMNLQDQSLYEALATRFGVRLAWAEQEITASAATSELAKWLGVERGSPLIATTRVARTDAGLPVEFTNGWTRPEYPLLVRLDA